MIFVSFHRKSSNETLLRLQKKLGMDYDEYVAFSNGVYMQIVDRGGKDEDKK